MTLLIIRMEKAFLIYQPQVTIPFNLTYSSLSTNLSSKLSMYHMNKIIIKKTIDHFIVIYFKSNSLVHKGLEIKSSFTYKKCWKIKIMHIYIYNMHDNNWLLDSTLFIPIFIIYLFMCLASTMCPFFLNYY